MTTTKKTTREASRNQALVWFEERKKRKESAKLDVDSLAASTDITTDVPSRKPAKRTAAARKKVEAPTKAQDSQKPKRTTRATRATKDDDSIASVSSKESTSSIRKLIKRVTRPLKKNATAKGTSDEVEKQTVRRSTRKSISTPVPAVTAQRVITRRSGKADDIAVEDVAATTPSKVNTAKKSNCARKPISNEELQTVLSPALGSFKELVSPSDSLSTTFSFNEMSFASVAASVAEFSVEEISIVKSKVSEAVHEDVPTMQVEEPTADDNVKLAQCAADSPASVDQDAVISQESKVLAEEETSFDGLVLVETEDNSVDNESAQEENTESEASEMTTSVTTTVPVSAAIALTAAMIAFTALLAYALLQSNAAEYFEEGAAQTQNSVSALFDNDGSIMQNVQTVISFAQTFSKELHGKVTGSNTSWERDLAMAVTGGVYSLSFFNAPKTTFAASVFAVGAVVCVMN